MSVLHVAAMPFPTVQGTQAAVRAMIEAEHEAGRQPALLTYAHAGYELTPAWPIHRVRDLSRDRSLRSGPSLRKLASDAQLALKAARLGRKLRPSTFIAHHVEAAAAVLAARLEPFVFVAHTALGPELPTYLPQRFGALAAKAGDALDVALARRASRTLAVSPQLAERLAEASGRPVRYLPVPWTIPPPIEPGEREKARTRFGFGPLEPVLLYAGNLDAYQGVERLAQAFAIVTSRRPEARLLIATTSANDAFERALWSLGCKDRVTFAPLADEPDRRVAHAAADVACIPREAAGGLPIKLLDALARGVPTVATRRATAGLALEGAAMVVGDDDPEALAAAALLTIEARESMRERAQRGIEYVRREHSPQRYLEALDAALQR